jgi:hypothetical protein
MLVKKFIKNARLKATATKSEAVIRPVQWTILPKYTIIYDESDEEEKKEEETEPIRRAESFNTNLLSGKVLKVRTKELI